MRYQARFAIGLVISGVLHAAVLEKYWSNDWFVRTPNQKTTVFRVRVLQPETPAPSKMLNLAEASEARPSPPETAPEQAAPKPLKKRHKPKNRPAPKPKKKPAKQQTRSKQAKSAVKEHVADKRATANPTAAPSSTPRQLASAGRIATLEDQYRALVRKKIERHKFYPARAKRQRKQGTATVAFELAPDGSVSGLKLVGKCGSSVLNRAALEAVKRVGRFPPFPRGVTRVSWAFEIPLNYRIR